MYCEHQQVCCTYTNHLSGYTCPENTRFTKHLKSMYSAFAVSHCRSVVGLLIFQHFQDTAHFTSSIQHRTNWEIPRRIVTIIPKLLCLEERKLADSRSLLPEKILYSVEQLEEDSLPSRKELMLIKSLLALAFMHHPLMKLHRNKIPSSGLHLCAWEI